MQGLLVAVIYCFLNGEVSGLCRVCITLFYSVTHAAVDSYVIMNIDSLYTHIGNIVC